MKKILVSILCFMSLTMLIACGENTSKTDSYEQKIEELEISIQELKDENKILKDRNQELESREAKQAEETEYEEMAEAQNEDIPKTDLPEVSIDDILSGAYNGQTVIVEAVIDNLVAEYRDTYFSKIEFDLWHKTQDGYMIEQSNWFHEVKEDNPVYCLGNAENGDQIKIGLKVYDDGSFGTIDTPYIEITGHEDVAMIRDAFFNQCQDIDIESLLRNPDKYTDQYYKFSGTIKQIVDESSYSVKYVVQSGSEDLYCSWYLDESARGERLLEGDSIVCCGKFEGLTTQTTLMGTEKTLPNIIIVLINRQ